MGISISNCLKHGVMLRAIKESRIPVQERTPTILVVISLSMVSFFSKLSISWNDLRIGPNKKRGKGQLYWQSQELAAAINVCLS